MHVTDQLHLAYCTNIHRGEDWNETFSALKEHTLAVRDRVSPDSPFAIGLRLSDVAARELADGDCLAVFKNWLEEENCYVFTINGFPYGRFHGTSVKEQVYLPDWTSSERVRYTKLLFELLAELVPEGGEGSVSTVPGSFKEFGIDTGGRAAMYAHLLDCAHFLEALGKKRNLDLHLGLEPEPLCYIETTAETIDFFEGFFAMYPDDEAVIRRRIGVNYDTCHLGVEFEQAGCSLGALEKAGIRISKLHLSSALRLVPEGALLDRLRAFEEDIYLHQVVINLGRELRRFRDLGPALAYASDNPIEVGEEWRVHYHVPLHQEPSNGLQTTVDHLIETLDWLAENPDRCHHLEMETYTWEVLPEDMRQASVVDQLEKEYVWCLAELEKRGLVT
ncbi:MAG: metabolite traffic protein EboE [Verrucomicrobiota bacterium]